MQHVLDNMHQMAMCEVTIGHGFCAEKEDPSAFSQTSSSSGVVASVRCAASSKLRLSDVLLNKLGQSSHTSSSTIPPLSLVTHYHVPGSIYESLIPQAPEWSLLPGLENYRGRRYHKSMALAARMLPCWHHEGFFIAKLKKLH